MRLMLFGFGLLMLLLTAVVLFGFLVAPGMLAAAHAAHGEIGVLAVILPIIAGLTTGCYLVLASARFA